jgi:hypothetical protein
MRIAIIGCVLACSSPAPTPTAPAKPVDAASPIPPIVAAALTCELEGDWNPGRSYAQSGNVVHVRVASVSPGPVMDQSRCVALDLEIVGAYRGDGKPGDHVKLIIKQSMIEHYTSRPAGAWWIVEQSLEPGSEYIAMCAPGKLADLLRGSCTVMVAAPHLANLAIVRDADVHHLVGIPLIQRLRTTCSIADEIATSYVWDQTGQQALTDIPLFEALLSVVLEPSCSQTARAVMIDELTGLAISGGTPAHLVRVVRTMFKLLAMPEASGFHDNAIGTWLPNAIGLEGGLPKLKPTDVFSGEPKFRADAAKTLADYKGTADTKKLRAWIK